MNKNTFCPTPPMGWNSYDYYNTEVNEAQVRANAEYMAAHLKEAGWEYIVIDIEWYAVSAGSESEKFQYIPFGELMMDEYSRLIPDPVRFPSSADGKGFGPLADYIHSLGLKFGIHIMRGIPRNAAHNHMALMGTDMRADRLADPSNICSWNPDMYGLRANLPEAQLYYNSIMELYTSWGVDFIKCDDICREDAATAHKEIELLHNAILACGRPIVLSLSPGPAKISEAAYYAENANMWRITDDFWDSWPLLKDMFRRCELWQGKAEPGCWPDCDMLPIGIIGGCFGERIERRSTFTDDELRTMMSLWAIFGSPLMIGGELTKMDPVSLAFLTNRDLLRMHKNGRYAVQIERTDDHAIWMSRDPEEDTGYIALFNLADEERAVHLWTGPAADRGLKPYNGGPIREIWTDTAAAFSTGGLACLVPAHGVRVFLY
ncbi:MAG: glycoside hydrolase family 27 protein [Blautia sp.]|nr:glycoside hydrolase family 27 protein [Blautia sp.]